MITQLNSRFSRDLTDLHKSLILDQILDQLDITIGWVDENEFYLHHAKLTEKAELLKDWVDSETKQGVNLFKSIDSILKATGIPNDSEKLVILRNGIIEKLDEVVGETQPPVPFLKINRDIQAFVEEHLEEFKCPTGAARYRSLSVHAVKDLDVIASMPDLAQDARYAAMEAVIDRDGTARTAEVKRQMIQECLALNSKKVEIPGIGAIEKFKNGCIGYHMGNNNIVIIYDYEGRQERTPDEDLKTAKSFWERFCKDRPDGPRKDVRIHVRYGAETIRSEDNLIHYAVALNRSVDATFTPVRVS